MCKINDNSNIDIQLNIKNKYVHFKMIQIIPIK